jgi:hypothetical protein
VSVRGSGASRRRAFSTTEHGNIKDGLILVSGERFIKLLFHLKLLHISRPQLIYGSIYGSIALCWTLAAFQFLDLLHSR